MTKHLWQMKSVTNRAFNAEPQCCSMLWTVLTMSLGSNADRTAILSGIDRLEEDEDEDEENLVADARAREL